MPSDLASHAEEATFTYIFNNRRPIELVDLTSSLLALGQQYQAFMRRQGEGLADDNYRLYVREVRTGSIVIDLISYAFQPQILAPFTPFLIQFTRELADWFEFFKGVKDAKDIKELLLGKSKRIYSRSPRSSNPRRRIAGATLPSMRHRAQSSW